MEAFDIYTKALYGENAIQVPMHFIVQTAGEREGFDCVSFVGACAYGKPNPMRFGSTLTHQLVKCDVVIRPHLVIESNHFAGHGLTGLARGPLAGGDEWIEHGRILIRP